MNRDFAPMPPPHGHYRPSYSDSDAPSARKPARVPLWTAALVALAILPVGLSGGDGLDGAMAMWAALVYGLGIIAALLVVAALAKLAGSRAVGVIGTLMVFGFLAFGLVATGEVG